MRSVDISKPALTGCHRTDVTLPHPDAIPSDQPCWLPGMSESSFPSFLPSLEHDLRCHDQMYADSGSTMRVFMWHRDQNALASCLLQLLPEHDGLSDALLTFIATRQLCWRWETKRFSVLALCLPCRSSKAQDSSTEPCAKRGNNSPYSDSQVPGARIDNFQGSVPREGKVPLSAMLLWGLV